MAFTVIHLWHLKPYIYGIYSHTFMVFTARHLWHLQPYIYGIYSHTFIAFTAIHLWHVGNSNIHAWWKILFRNVIKFGRYWNSELKIILEIYCQILIRVLTKVGINSVHFAWTKVNKIKPCINICSKREFSTNHPNWRYI